MPVFKTKLGKVAGGISPTRRSRFGAKINQTKTNPKETPIRIKERVIELRKNTNLCAKKLKWKLEKENIVLHKNTIQKSLKKKDWPENTG